MWYPEDEALYAFMVAPERNDERTLSAEEFDARRRAPTSQEEDTENRALIALFCRRYPTAAERLAFARRASTRHRDEAIGQRRK